MNKRPICIVAGGTGGHVFPASHVVKAMLKQGEHLIWVGRKDSLEQQVAQDLGVRFIVIDALPWIKRIRNIAVLIHSIVFNWIWIVRLRPKLILSFGGYVSVPMSVASIFYPVPLIIHEQNITPGMANRLLHLFSCRTLVAYKGSLKRSHYVGNPVSPNIKARLRQCSQPLRILITGGSQGSRTLNWLGCKIQEHFGDKIDIWLQCGKKKVSIKEDIQTMKITPFIDDMAVAYDWADMVICRAGALTLAEIRRAALPAILIPYPHAADNHQANNALYMTERSFAIRILEDNRTQERLLHTLEGVLNGLIDINSISEKLLQARISNSCQMIIRHCQEVINK